MLFNGVMTKKSFDWAVVGAGPAGIAAVGKLIDHKVSPEKICWIDSHFTVGDLGRKWNNVPSNTRVELFLRFIHASPAFEYKQRPKKFVLEDLDPKENCPLQHVVDPLQWITEQLKRKVHAIQNIAMLLNLSHNLWEIKTEGASVHAKNVILAIGAEPKTLPYTAHETISLETALDPEKLAKHVHPRDVIGVFGSSHSAILVLANLLKLNPKSVINFYRSPHRYAVYLDDWILFDSTGLKGYTAEWARNSLDGPPPEKLKRVLVSDHIFDEFLVSCNKLIYATGFDKRKLPILEQYQSLVYDDKTGIIAPGLFGLGIAFPQSQFDRLGHLEFRVGLWKFMDYLNSILPIWLKSGN